MKTVYICHRVTRRHFAVLVSVFTLLSFAFLTTMVLAKQSRPTENRLQKDTAAGEELPLPDIRAGELIGQNVQNSQGNDIAEIYDLIVDRRGRIRHIILSVGGLLGVAEKLVAVDFENLQDHNGRE